MEFVGTIHQLDKVQHIVKIRIDKNSETSPRKLSIGVSNSIDSRIIRSAIYRYANHLINTPQSAHVATELLTRNPPRVKGKAFGAKLVNSNEVPSEILKIAAALDHSYLLIQGPPGSGKTQICSQLIIDLIARGKKIGISSNSHCAIHNLLGKVEKLAAFKNIRLKGIKKASKGNSKSFFNGKLIQNKTKITKTDLDANLYAGTAWTFSSSLLDRHLDYLFIDEAGQVSTANAIAMSNATENIILVGDHMQLDHPKRGIHPQEAGFSIMEFLLGEHTTIPENRGIFLSQSYRLKPNICRFISDTFYECRLIAHESTRAKNLRLKGTELPNEGIVMINVKHEKCSNQSSEEAKIIKHLYHTLLGQDFINENQTVRGITTDDILVVTPYNAQVDYLCSLLPDSAKVGTVDKFQGQEAPIVLISMVTSNIGYLSHKIIEFLYSRNRLNVALSRAQCLAIVVASHKLREVACTTVEQMKLVNTYCRLDQYAKQLTIEPSLYNDYPASSSALGHKESGRLRQ